MAKPLQLRAREAVKALERIDRDALSPERRAVVECMLKRFGDGATARPDAPGDRFADAVLTAYRQYWYAALRGEEEPVALEEKLFERLRSLFEPREAPEVSGMDDLEPLLQDRLTAGGFHSLHGITPPLREVMIWRRTESRSFEVDLPTGRETVRVEFLSDFLSRGWAHFATCGRSSAGGWVGEDRLFAIRDSYDVDSETFRVGYLAHEGQHFHDRRERPGLTPEELEYRAKLVELSLARDTLDETLRNFAANALDDPAFPHSHANLRVLDALTTALGISSDPNRLESLLLLSPGDVNAAARALLAEDDHPEGPADRPR